MMSADSHAGLPGTVRAVLTTLLVLVPLGCGNGSSNPVPDLVPDVFPDVAAVDTVTDMGEEPKTPESLAAMVDPAKYLEDLVFVADVRPPGSVHWQAVQDLCIKRFKELGFTVERQEYGENGTGVNVIGVREGTTSPEERVIVSAHYDHIPDCPGADDNGSGVAGLLEVARVLSEAEYARTLVVACWDQEEFGLVGSAAYAIRAKAQNENIIVSFVFEMIGFKSDEPDSQMVPMGFDLLFEEQTKWLADHDNRGDFLAIVPDEGAHDPAMLIVDHADKIGLPTVVLEVSAALKNSPVIADLRRSDHAPFWLNDYPAMMITDTANFRNPYYHCGAGPDVVENLDTEFAAQIIEATVSAAATTLEIIQN